MEVYGVAPSEVQGGCWNSCPGGEAPLKQIRYQQMRLQFCIESCKKIGLFPIRNSVSYKRMFRQEAHKKRKLGKHLITGMTNLLFAIPVILPVVRHTGAIV